MQMNHKYIVYAGNYGSGKTELSLNTALKMAQRGSGALVDVDVVNPYFRSSESAAMLEAHGIRLIKPPFANTAVDVPAISAEVMAAFKLEWAVFDAGGDPVGANVLGSIHEGFDKVRERMVFYYVVNVRRPFQEDIDDAADMLRQIEQNARLKVDGLVNNGNLGPETTLADIDAGLEMCAQLTERTGIPLAFTSGRQEVIGQLKQRGYTGETFEIDIFTRPEWLDSERSL